MSSVEIPRCQHIKVNGVQCGSPALRRKKFCYFHQRWRNYRKPRVGGKYTDPITWFELPPLEDANSVQEAVMQVTRLVLCGRMTAKPPASSSMPCKSRTAISNTSPSSPIGKKS